MLQNIRDNSQGLIAKFIIGLIIIPFALFGIDSLVGGGGPINVATVNGEDIAAGALDQAVELERRRRMNMMGENFDPAMLDEKILRGPALQQLISQQLLLQAADKSSIGFSAQALDQTIASMPQFQQDQRFSPELYRNVLRSNGYSTAYFKQLMAKDLLINQLNGGVAGSDFVTESELQLVAKIVGQQRSYRYLLLPGAEARDQVVVSDEDIDTYYQQHLDNFQTQDQLKLDYIEIKSTDFTTSVSDSDLRAEYELEMDSFEAQEERRAAHILIEVNEERTAEQAIQQINELTARLNAGESFKELAKNSSDDLASAQNGGDLGYTSGATFPQAFEQALAKLPLNELSGPVKTEAGYHLIKATDIKSAEKPSFDDRKDNIRQRIQAAAAESELVRVVENLKDLVFNSEGLSGPAKELNLVVKTSALIGRDSAEGVLANPQVMAAAFSEDVLEERNNSEVIELAPDHFIVVSVIQHQPPATKALSVVRDDIVAILKRQQMGQLMLKLAKQIIDQLKAGVTFADIAEQKGYQWQLEQTVTRSSTTANRDVLMAAFSRSESSMDIPMAETLANGDVAIVQLEEIIDGSWQNFSMAEQQSIKMELQRNTASQSFTRYMESLRARAEITVL